MSVHLNAVKLVVVTEDALMVNHDNTVVTNKDCPKGTVLAYDRGGNLYICDCEHTREFFTESAKLPTRYPRKADQLYRDYWKHIASGPNTPYGASFRNAPHTVILEVR